VASLDQELLVVVEDQALRRYDIQSPFEDKTIIIIQ